MDFSKGQSSVEYLMNYAWALALVLIAVGAIFALDIGGLTSGISGTGSSSGEGFETVAVTGHRVYSCNPNCNLDLAVQNNGEEKINLTSVEIMEMDGTTINGMVTAASTCNAELFPGERTTCLTMEFDAQNVGTFTVDDPYTLRIALNYTILDFSNNPVTTQTPERTLQGHIEAG